jgi:nucleolar complex protein 3
MPLFRSLAQLASSKNVTVKKLALATQLAVYKDVIPGYRIRPLSENDMTTKVSKEIRRLRSFEQSLVAGYQNYIRELARLAKEGRGNSIVKDAAGLSSVAISCACGLLVAVPHFNFRVDVLKALVDKLSGKRVDDDFIKCRETLETVFRNDEDGAASLDAVTLLTKMMKARHYRVDESVLNIFLHLRLLSEFSSKGSQDSIDRPDDPGNNIRGKKKLKEKKQFRTKAQRKIEKERKAVEKEFKEADATVSHEERDHRQAETLKLVFVTYFRILKARTPHLMGAVLEGLAKYAHLINQDFFGDLLEALKDLIGHAASTDSTEEEDVGDYADETNGTSQRNAVRESLLCITTAFALLHGQDNSTTGLNLDLSFFTAHLYRTLYPLSLNPDLELSAKSLHLQDPNHPSQPPKNNKVNIATTTILLLRSLSYILLPPRNTRAVPPVRVAAFTKQLMTISLQLPEKSCVAMLALLTKVAKSHGRKMAGLWNTEERRGDGVFDPLRAEVEGSNPYASTVWEGEILKRHFCPSVREEMKALESVIGRIN